MSSALASRGTRAAFAVILWVAAALPPALIALDAASPGAGAAWADAASRLGRSAALIGAGAFAAALLLYPPSLPWLRLAWRRQKARMSVDQGPVLGARERLRHLPTAKDHLIVGRAALEMGDLPRALSHLLPAVQLDPDAVAARFALAQVLRRAGRLDDAIGHLGLVVAKDPGHAYGQALLELARALELRGLDLDALHTLERHEDLHGDHRGALLARAQILQRLRRRDEARAVLVRAAAPATSRLDPEQALARARARVALWRLGGAAAAAPEEDGA